MTYKNMPRVEIDSECEAVSVMGSVDVEGDVVNDVCVGS